MLISLNKRLTFLAMPKAASTSIEMALFPYCDIAFINNPRVKHIRYRRYKRFILPYIDQSGFGPLETTCLFREPVDWLFSWYRYRSRDKIKAKPQSTANMSFDDFVSRYMDEDANIFDIGRTSFFVIGHDGIPAVDHIYRYENLPAYTKFLESRFEEKFDLEHLNESPKRDFALSAPLKTQLEQFLTPEYDIYEAARTT
ncbi:MAG: gamma-glutamyl kinase [Rhodobacteraceae bacterium]|nr:MAG: gamma-glutamyl kinase [Paracoccaceae bacterium]